MKITAFLLAACIVCPPAAADNRPPRIVVVLDASASMATSWPGHEGDRIGAVRTSIDALAGVLRGRKTQPQFAIRVYGDQLGPDSVDACTDTRLVRPWAPADIDDLATSLDAVKPRGSGSLVLALEETASDLGAPGSDDLVLVILDGLDWCGGDLEKGFGSLTLEGEGAEVHVFGFGLDVTDQAELSSHAAFHSISWPTQLLQMVSMVISKRLSLPLLPESAGLDLVGADRLGFALKALDIVGTWTKEPISVDMSREKPRIKAGLGTATIEASGPEEGQLQRLLRVPVMPANLFHLEFFEPLKVNLSIVIHESGWDRPPVLEASWNGASMEGLHLVLSENGVPGASWFHNLGVAEPTGSAFLPLPAKPMEMSLQLRRPIGHSAGVISEIVFSSPGRTVGLEAPSEAEAGATIGVSWNTESYPGDLLNLVPAGAPAEWLGSTCEALGGSPCDFLVPFDPCSYEIRYIDGRSFEVLGRTSLEVGAQAAGLLASAIASTSDTVTVRWWGPAAPLDVITLSAIGSENSEYLEWASPADGSPARIRVPREPGDYEIRYLAEGKEIAAFLPLTVEEVAVTLDVPTTARVGGRMRVAWTGPNGPDDFLVLVRPGRNINRQLDFAYVSAGSPISMAVPDRPGTYEIQYISGHPRQVLGSATVEVVK